VRRRDGMAATTVYTELTIVRQWLNFYVHIADEQAQVTMRQLAVRRHAAGRPAKPAQGRQGISKVSAKSRR